MRFGAMSGVIVVTLGVAACTGAVDPAPSAGTPSTIPATESSNGTTPAAPRTTDAARDPDCTPSGGLPWTAEVSVDVREVLRTGDGLVVRAAEYPIPDGNGNPWSQWGQGIVTSDGRFLSAVGDHLGSDANSWFFVFDPVTGSLTRIGDVLSLIDHRPGSWGFGKVHAQMVSDSCGNVLVTSYWGTRRGLSYDDDYRGDVVISIDPGTETITSRGVLRHERGVPSLAIAPESGLLYGEAVDPFVDGNTGEFVVYDLEQDRIVFEMPKQIGFRSMAVDADERVYVSSAPGKLGRFDPDSRRWEPIDDPIPGEFLRAATLPDAAGVVYAVSQDPAVFFSIDRDGSIDVIAEAVGYTTSLALDAERGLVYSVPRAHGAAFRLGTPLMALDIESGALDTVVELNPAVEDALGLSLGGTYDLAFDPVTRRLFAGFNAAPAGSDESFGTVVLVTVDLP